MGKLYYSAQTLGFYDDSIHGDQMPADVVEVSAEEYALLISSQGSNSIQPDEAGRPVLVAGPQESPADALERAIVDIRIQREPILNALAGIGLDAVIDGDAVITAGVAVARAGLKNIIQLPELAAAPDYESMRLIVKAEYARLVEAAPDAVKTAFREVMG